MRQRSIMVVEDEMIVAEDLAHWLVSLGYSIAARAANGREALQRCEATRPDLVLMDILLPGDMDGIQVATQIRDRYDIPVVYITASSDDATLARAKVTEPFGYILKPFDERSLYSTIEMALYKHQSEKRLRESEERYRLLFENSPVAFQSLDADGHILRVNKAWLELFGMASDEVLGRWFGELLAPGSVDRFIQHFTQFKHSPVTESIDLEVVLRDGSILSGMFKGNIAVDHRGMFEMTQCVLEGQARTAARKTTRTGDRRSAAVRPESEGNGTAGVLLRRDGTIAGTTPALFALLGWPPDHRVADSLRDLVVLPGVADDLLKVLFSSGMLGRRLVEVLGGDGVVHPVHVSGWVYQELEGSWERACLILHSI